jgi:Zn-dependent alcohol dehydrogenase
VKFNVALQVIREMTDGGVDYSFECTGINDVLREAFLSTHEVRRDYIQFNLLLI